MRTAATKLVCCAVGLALLAGCRLPKSHDVVANVDDSARGAACTADVGGDEAAGTARMTVSPAAFEGGSPREMGPTPSGRPGRDGHLGPQSRGRLDELVAIERSIDVGQIDQWRVKIDLVLPNQVSNEQLPVIVCLYQASGAQDTVIAALSQIAARGKHAGVALACIHPIDTAHPNTAPELALALNWLETNAAGMGVAPSRVGVWVQNSDSHILYTLERGTHNLLSSTTIPFQSPNGPRIDGGLAEVEAFFNLQLRGERAQDGPEHGRGSARDARGFGPGEFGGRSTGWR
jgi:hypothetical protein